MSHEMAPQFGNICVNRRIMVKDATFFQLFIEFLS